MLGFKTARGRWADDANHLLGWKFTRTHTHTHELRLSRYQSDARLRMRSTRLFLHGCFGVTRLRVGRRKRNDFTGVGIGVNRAGIAAIMVSSHDAALIVGLISGSQRRVCLESHFVRRFNSR